MATLFRELNEADLRRALALVQVLVDASLDHRAFVLCVLDRLTQLVASDLTTLSLCDLQRGTRTVLGRRHRGLVRPAARDDQPLTVARLGLRLTVRFVARPDDASSYLLLKDERRGVSDAELAPLPLTKREREVLALVAAGKTNAEVAILLAVSARTVQKHLEHIFQKLGVETRTAAALRALAAADISG
ncbi:MAG: helix-turn-helix transcriptional regulator [Hyphomonadaceae bacterium]|jgi:DNA-binding CsgD family transcriptional regulator|nr:helix-turn-helix transcriptional regulator [Hyphomonadaceae bacterium]